MEIHSQVKELSGINLTKDNQEDGNCYHSESRCEVQDDIENKNVISKSQDALDIVEEKCNEEQHQEKSLSSSVIDIRNHYLSKPKKRMRDITRCDNLTEFPKKTICKDYHSHKKDDHKEDWIMLFEASSSKNPNLKYKVKRNGNLYRCSCPDFKFRGRLRPCRHIREIKS